MKRAFENKYLLGHDTTEIGRLEVQARLFKDAKLDELAQKANTCLEIGCGVGSNAPILLVANPSLKYVGIDNSQQAIAEAKVLHHGLNLHFSVMDAKDLDFENHSFDLVISKLLLWSVGLNWKLVVEEALRVLKPGGIFYAFEPYCEGMVFSPSAPVLEAAIDKWHKDAVIAGSDPHIGPKVPVALQEAGFSKIESNFFAVTALTSEPSKYLAVCDNLRKFYFAHSENKEAIGELYEAVPGGLVMDSFFVTVGVKP